MSTNNEPRPRGEHTDRPEHTEIQLGSSFAPLKTLAIAIAAVSAVMGLVTGSVGFAVLFWLATTAGVMFISVPMAIGNHLSSSRRPTGKSNHDRS